ncbi:MAG TPA: DEAD/DEAH box helicase family protein [Paludibacter sp.]|nr:DEAD/DEAH box helicase family protein [Paludibacter sp.]
MAELKLYEEIYYFLKQRGTLPELPTLITENLNPEFELRPYQIESLRFFLHYFENEDRKRPTQLLFHMATGSGKTLIMAALILYLYQQGYRNFIFFVDSTTIIEKTKDNFLNPQSSKYLFAPILKIDGEVVTINPVDNFQAATPHAINIIFSTIQGLHTTLNTPRENALTYLDFEDKDIVLISDEAHHINALTKNSLTVSDAENINSWEATVHRIFKANDSNLLLEFTATAQLSHPEIERKYRDKILYDYPLKRFREDGYSKDVRTLPTDIPQMERAMQALIISQYRKKVAERHQISLKPVVMMKANYVNPPSKPDPNKVVSGEFRKDFHARVSSLTGEDLMEIQQTSSQPILHEAFKFFSENGISLDNLALELKNDFSEEKSLAVDSKSDSEQHQILVNSLEDPQNEIRVVFAVEMLNEGWDVLNLFDIVRLYDTRDAKDGVPGKTTVSEAQLIGRGARYYPFQLDEDQPRYQRKFDDLEEERHPLRMLEVLYYHSAHNPRYIQELHKALVHIGMKPENQVRHLRLLMKDDFKNSELWEQGVLFKNKRIRNDSADIFEIKESLIQKSYPCRIMTGRGKDIDILGDDELPELTHTITKTIKLNSFSLHLLRSALSRIKFFEFRNLKNYFPNLNSIKEFITSDNYLGKISVAITATQNNLNTLSSFTKLRIAVSVLQKLADDIRKGTPDYIGTREFIPVPIKQVVAPEIPLKREYKPESDVGTGMRETIYNHLAADLRQEPWYVYDENYGTSEEKALVKLIQGYIPDLEKKYRAIYLLRNEKLFEIYDFDEGRRFEPDFVLFLTDKKTGKQIHYQLFIEPKGEFLSEHDSWKEDFLLQIEQEAKINLPLPKHDYNVIGLPFYNSGNPHVFETAFEQVLLK